MEKGEALTGSTEQWRDVAAALVLFRSMQRPESRKLTSSAAAVLKRAGVLRRERLKMRRRRGEMERLSGPIYKERVTGGHEKRGGQRMIIQLIGRLDFQDGY